MATTKVKKQKKHEEVVEAQEQEMIKPAHEGAKFDSSKWPLLFKNYENMNILTSHLQFHVILIISFNKSIKEKFNRTLLSNMTLTQKVILNLFHLHRILLVQ